LSHAATSTT